MIALALVFAYMASLAFAGFLLWRRDRYREDVRDALVNVRQRLAAIDHKAPRWDAAASYVEAQNVRKGLIGAGR